MPEIEFNVGLQSKVLSNEIRFESHEILNKCKRIGVNSIELKILTKRYKYPISKIANMLFFIGNTRIMHARIAYVQKGKT